MVSLLLVTCTVASFFFCVCQTLNSKGTNSSLETKLLYEDYRNLARKKGSSTVSVNCVKIINQACTLSNCTCIFEMTLL